MTQHNWSVPETEVMQRVRDRLGDDTTDVLATIVHVEGNAYRRPGAKMLLDEAGSGVGAITAGCLEDELLRVGSEVREVGHPRLVTYDLMDDDEDDVWGLGVGCNGIIEVLLEPLTETYRPAVDAFFGGRPVGVVTVLDGGDGPLAQGDRAYYDPEDGTLVPATGDAGGWPSDAVERVASELTARASADTVTVSTDAGDVTLFVEGLAPPNDLVVFGTGHDVGPVTDLAAKNDFRVTVVGFRGAVDVAERFPAADRTLTTSPGRIAEDVSLDERTYAVVMTHNFVDDRLTVETLLDSPVPYVGLMGPRDRFDQMLADFADEGTRFDDVALESLYTPVGLDLGGGSPWQIAHSIVAEALAVSNDRQPRHLKERAGPIHERVDVTADEGAPTQ